MSVYLWNAGNRVTAARLRATTPLQVYAQLYLGAANQTIANNTPTDIIWTAADQDSASGWNPGVNPQNWYAPVTGLYNVQFVAPWASSSTGRRVCSLRVDGVSKTGQSIAATSAANACTSNAARLLLIPAGKPLAARVFHTAGTGLDVLFNTDDGTRLDISLYAEV